MHIKDAYFYRTILQQAEAYFTPRANPQNVIKYARYFKETYNAWGVDITDVQALASIIQADYPELTIAQLIELGLLLFAQGKQEMGTLAIRLLENRLKDCDAATLAGLRSWFDQGVSNWAHADYLCTKLSPWFLLQQIVRYQDFQPWLDSESRWTRRAVPVTLIKIKQTADPDGLLSFVEPLMQDPARVVHQGTGWFLRELWKVQPQKVEDFLYKHRNTAARLIIQYATEKLSKADRLRFRKDKVPR